jgi:hypothetical protein
VRPASAPQACSGCGDQVRHVIDINTRGEIFIDAAQVAGDVGNVVVQQIEPGLGWWLVDVYNRPGPPEPMERWDTYPPPSLWTIHVCSSVPSSWPTAAAGAERQEVATP